MIAAPVQCDVDGIPKRSHYARVPIAMGRPNGLGVDPPLAVGSNALLGSVGRSGTLIEPLAPMVFANDCYGKTFRTVLCGLLNLPPKGRVHPVPAAKRSYD